MIDWVYGSLSHSVRCLIDSSHQRSIIDGVNNRPRSITVASDSDLIIHWVTDTTEWLRLEIEKLNWMIHWIWLNHVEIQIPMINGLVHSIWFSVIVICKCNYESLMIECDHGRFVFTLFVTVSYTYPYSYTVTLVSLQNCLKSINHSMWAVLYWLLTNLSYLLTGWPNQWFISLMLLLCTSVWVSWSPTHRVTTVLVTRSVLMNQFSSTDLRHSLIRRLDPWVKRLSSECPSQSMNRLSNN